VRTEHRFEVAAPRERVWRSITDPALMLECIPGCDAIEPIGERRYRAGIVVEIGPIKVRFNLTVELTREDPPASVASVTRGEEGTRASILASENLLTLAELPGERTEVRYCSEVSVTGRLAKYGLGVMKKKVDRIGGEFAERFRSRVEALAGVA
jgi:carbon monoxide dehydrogenase subunit G